ncbi:hypothetical protein [Prauserella muralis]|uniref:hypothetical protein n=1 Tax=Prauserella muralis TaxID=588067 RepID=UPI0011ACF305|nr:hypothetical protein [Prauserella muralis]TWE22545.1 hypothetical protein FHX69_3789 [Prauserella muralis]
MSAGQAGADDRRPVTGRITLDLALRDVLFLAGLHDVLVSDGINPASCTALAEA